MDLLRSLPLGVFLFALAMVLLLAAAMAFAAVAARRKASALAALTPVAPHGLTAGYRLVTGRAMGPLLAAPLTGRPCVWYEVRVWESVRETHDGKTDWHWREMVQETPDRGVEISDGSVSCLVRHDGAEVHCGKWSEWTGDDNPPENANPPVRPGTEMPGDGLQISLQGSGRHRFRFRESMIAVNAPVFALGDCTAAPPHVAGDPEDGERFPEERTARWVMRKAPGKPFLLSTRQPDAVGADSALAARAALPFALALAALAAVMLWARFGG